MGRTVADTQGAGQRQPSIWWFAFGYFACYVPYSALTKALTDGLIPGASATGLALLPASVFVSMLGMFVALSALGWWRYAGRRRLFGLSLPWPGRWTFLSGLCTAAIIGTTTLAYTFHDASIVFMMLLMRGGVLVIAPIVDAISGRRVRWFSWLALALSLAALGVTFAGRGRGELQLPGAALADVAVYLLSYFVRLRFMSRLAKSDDPDATKRYFAEEQMTATPAVVVFLAALALVGPARVAGELAHGFSGFLLTSAALVALVIGLLSQGTGVFGGLILLDKRENTFCVPVNRASSILAGLGASASLYWIFGVPAPPASELWGAGLIVVAVLFLSIPSLKKARS